MDRQSLFNKQSLFSKQSLFNKQSLFSKQSQTLALPTLYHRSTVFSSTRHD